MNFQQYDSFQQARQGLEARGFKTPLNYQQGSLHAPDGAASYLPCDLRLVEYHRFSKTNDSSSSSNEGGKIIFAFETKDGKATLTKDYEDRLDLKIVSFIDKVPMGISQSA